MFLFQLLYIYDNFNIFFLCMYPPFASFSKDDNIMALIEELIVSIFYLILFFSSIVAIFLTF